MKTLHTVGFVLLLGLLSCTADRPTAPTPTAPSTPAPAPPPAPPQRDLFTLSGTGNTVFDLPGDVNRLRITGRFDGFGQNFAVWIGNRLVVNEILGTCGPPVCSGQTYDGTHQVSGTTGVIEKSNGVVWTVTEIR